MDIETRIEGRRGDWAAVLVVDGEEVETWTADTKAEFRREMRMRGH